MKIPITEKERNRERDRGFVMAMPTGKDLIAARGSNLASSPIMVASKHRNKHGRISGQIHKPSKA